MGHANFFRHHGYKKHKDTALIEIGPLHMGIKKGCGCGCDLPREVSLIVPRVEIRTSLKTPFFTFTKETIYNSVTIVDAPRAPLAGERDGKPQKMPGCRESLR